MSPIDKAIRNLRSAVVVAAVAASLSAVALVLRFIN